MKKKLLICDLNSILWTSGSVTKHLSFKGKRTSGIYGFITKFCSLINEHNPSDVLVALDAPPYDRKKIYPDYKKKSTKLNQELFEMINENRVYILNFLDEFDIPVIKYKGLEADDIISIIVENENKNFDNIIIAANDDDLFQMLKYKNVTLEMKKELYTRETFKKIYPWIEPEDFYRYTAMVGGHNKTPSVAGIGPKTVIKNYYEEYWESIYKEHKEVLDLAIKLIKLPYMMIDNLHTIEPLIIKSRPMILYLIKQFGIEIVPNITKAFNHLEMLSKEGKEG